VSSSARHSLAIDPAVASSVEAAGIGYPFNFLVWVGAGAASGVGGGGNSAKFRAPNPPTAGPFGRLAQAIAHRLAFFARRIVIRRDIHKSPFIA